jgi:Tol biopolymer transport system component
VNCQKVPTPPHQYGVGQFIFRDDVVDIFVADRAGGHVHRVTHNLLWPIRCLGNPTPCAEGHHDAESPSWSPDGSTIAYAAKGIWTVSAAGGHQVEVAVATGAGGTAWQPRRQ